MNKENILKIIKIAVGSTIAIVLAAYLELDYIPSAGIITLLTIQNTKKATLKLAVTRVLSFGLTIGLLGILLYLFSSHILVHGLFMLLMVGICYKLGWADTISVNATVGGQALILAGGVDLHFILNEAILVGIGILIAIILNMKMPDRRKELQKDIQYIEDTLRDLLHSIALHLHKKEQLRADREHISQLMIYIDRGLDKALENSDNVMKEHTRYFIEYLLMRRNQCVILIHFYRAVTDLKEIPSGADYIADFLNRMSQEFNVKNDASKRMEQLNELAEKLSAQDLPETKEEMVGRAVLYQLIKELEEFLRLKKVFLNELTEEQLELYW